MHACATGRGWPLHACWACRRIQHWCLPPPETPLCSTAPDPAGCLCRVTWNSNQLHTMTCSRLGLPEARIALHAVPKGCGTTRSATGTCCLALTAAPHVPTGRQLEYLALEAGGCSGDRRAGADRAGEHLQAQAQAAHAVHTQHWQSRQLAWSQQGCVMLAQGFALPCQAVSLPCSLGLSRGLAIRQPSGAW